MLANRPIALSLIAVAFIFQGIEAIVGMIGSLSFGKVNINLMFLLLFAGIGLLRLSDGWRRFTLACLGLAAVAMAGMSIFEVIRPGKIPVTWFGTVTSGASRYVLFATIWIIAGTVLWWAYRTLTHPAIGALFKKGPNQSPEPTAMSVTPPAAQEPRQP
jgi:hypothetical protein